MSAITSPSTATTSNGRFSYQITANNSPVRFGVTGQPGGLHILQGGILNGPVSPGTYSMGLTATNDAGDVASGTLTLTAVAPPPVSGPIDFEDEGKPVRLVGSDGAEIPLPGSPAAPAQLAVPVTTQSNESSAAVGTASGAVLAANADRKAATIVNFGTVGCFLSLSGTAVAMKGIYVAPNGGSYGIDSTNLYRGPISGITATGTTTLTVQEGQ